MAALNFSSNIPDFDCKICLASRKNGIFTHSKPSTATSLINNWAWRRREIDINHPFYCWKSPLSGGLVCYVYQAEYMENSPALTHLKIFVSFACNLKCPHCVHGQFPSAPVPPYDAAYLEKIERFLGEALEVNPGVHIYLSGGEPLLSRRFFQIAQLIRHSGLGYKTITNGLLLADRLDSILEAPPHSLWVTFNGLGDCHDAMVGRKGAFARLSNALKHALPVLRSRQIKIGAVLMINRSTFGRLSADLDALQEFGFDEVVVQHLSFLPESFLSLHRDAYLRVFGRPSGFCFGEGADGSAIEPELLFREIQSIRQKKFPFRVVIFPRLIEKEDLMDYYSDDPRKWLDKRCSRASGEFWILPDGSVTVCFAHKIGDTGDSLRQLLRSRQFACWQAQFRKLAQPLPGCARCHRLYMN
ncbi:MAG: radical SAM protein [Saprospirales bacterium]|nr:radical SAM protein [Saprospirales bacterium]